MYSGEFTTTDPTGTGSPAPGGRGGLSHLMSQSQSSWAGGGGDEMHTRSSTSTHGSPLVPSRHRMGNADMEMVKPNLDVDSKVAQFWRAEGDKQPRAQVESRMQPMVNRPALAEVRGERGGGRPEG